ncbi:MAG TPA: ABC-type transport auxiliary lipoprotein family protein [Candidatus Eisenbacteria bacterium]|nr:ABC-type transport auxiliary lipoprotein family protein [Candidatus Eisenbacteria bacterium]
MSAIETMIRHTGSLPNVRSRTRNLGRWVASAGAFVAVLAAGCGAPKPVHYFQLTHPPTTAISTAQTPIDAIILVRPLATTHLYRDDRIVYGDNSVELGLYDNNRWSEPPSELLRDALARGLRSSGEFRAVTTLRSEMGIDYYLTGQLYAFREVTGNGIAAKLHYDLELVDVRKGKTVWRHSYDRDEPVSGKTVADVVMAMDKNVHASVQEAQDGMVQALREYVQK